MAIEKVEEHVEVRLPKSLVTVSNGFRGVVYKKNKGYFIGEGTSAVFLLTFFNRVSPIYELEYLGESKEAYFVGFEGFNASKLLVDNGGPLSLEGLIKFTRDALDVGNKKVDEKVTYRCSDDLVDMFYGRPTDEVPDFDRLD